MSLQQTEAPVLEAPEIKLGLFGRVVKRYTQKIIEKELASYERKIADWKRWIELQNDLGNATIKNFELKEQVWELKQRIWIRTFLIIWLLIALAFVVKKLTQA